MRYRRVYIKGGCYFFTVVTEKRRKFFADADNVERLRMAFKTVMKKRPFVIDAAVVLPDHLHFSRSQALAWECLPSSSA
jgi:putative transposase